MSRYIDADALIDTLGISDEEIDFKEILREAPSAEVVSVEDYRSMENTCYKLQKALYEMAEAPSIDIVRCKECKHRPIKEDADEADYGFNIIAPNKAERCPCLVEDGWYSWMPEDNFYCGYGEREGE